ncbi:MAG: hypothetical protein K2L93_04970, partial [Muribaculaceae bacterium]|nr:hypothetical protein [Muribaculaceae bacterium]
LTYGTYYYIKSEGGVNLLDPENYGQYVRTNDEETITFPQMVCASTANYGDTNFSRVFGYYPTVFTITRDPGSVSEIIADDSDAAPMYYNLQGQPVANPANGIYIVRRGAKVTKEYLR